MCLLDRSRNFQPSSQRSMAHRRQFLDHPVPWREVRLVGQSPGRFKQAAGSSSCHSEHGHAPSSELALDLKLPHSSGMPTAYGSVNAYQSEVRVTARTFGTTESVELSCTRHEAAARAPQEQELPNITKLPSQVLISIIGIIWLTGNIRFHIHDFDRRRGWSTSLWHIFAIS